MINSIQLKKILFIYYSQSGQLKEILENISKPLIDKNFEITWYEIKTKTLFPFPWKSDDFFNSMPESVMDIPFEISNLNEIQNKKFDLIFLGYTTWYLSASIPISSFLKSEIAKDVLLNTPVITVVACRNMWTQAHIKILDILKNYNSRYIANILFKDKVNNLVSVITIYQWMVKGFKSKYLGIFPFPGISKVDIKNAFKFGQIISENVDNTNDKNNIQEKINLAKGNDIDFPLALVERTAIRIFKIWAKFILKKGDYYSKERLNRVRMFKIYLFVVIFLLLPVFQLIYSSIIFLNPKLKQKIIKQLS